VKDWIHHLDVPDYTFRRFRHSAGDRTRKPWSALRRSCWARPRSSHLDASSDLPRDRLTLGMIPVQNELLAPVLLDQVTVYGDRAIGEG